MPTEVVYVINEVMMAVVQYYCTVAQRKFFYGLHTYCICILHVHVLQQFFKVRFMLLIFMQGMYDIHNKDIY